MEKVFIRLLNRLTHMAGLEGYLLLVMIVTMNYEQCFTFIQDKGRGPERGMKSRAEKMSR